MDPTLRQMTFELGYCHGEQTGLYVTNRQVLERYPHMTAEMVDIYQNGRDDGVASDSWRLDRGRAALRNLRRTELIPTKETKLTTVESQGRNFLPILASAR